MTPEISYGGFQNIDDDGYTLNLFWLVNEMLLTVEIR